MKQTLTAALFVLLAAGTTAAKTVENSEPPRIHAVEVMSLEEGRFLSRELSAGAVADTVYFESWDFSDGPNCNDDGWHPVDRGLDADFWHVDDFAGLGGGTFGRLGPIQGNQSLWLGARPTGTENLDLCGYATLPGYGNAWSQRWCTKTCLSVTTGVTVLFTGKWDSEPGYDGTTLQIATCTGGVSDENWLATRPPNTVGGLWDGRNGGIYELGTVGPDSLVVESIPDSMHTGSVKIQFLFASDGGWSDEDGLWDTDGGIIIDRLRVLDDAGTILSVELFEDEAVGATSSDDWENCNFKGFSYGNNSGNYSNAYGDLYPALSLLQEDPCVTELDCVWAFIQGSVDDYSCGGFPGQAAVPKGPGLEGSYLKENIVSPIVPITSASPEVQLAIRLYADNPRDNLVYWSWHVRTFIDGCPTNWRDTAGVYRNDSKTWITVVYRLGDKFAPGATEIQVRTGVRDMCPVWCGVFGTGNCHSHAPLWDSVSIYAIEHDGPVMQWPFGGQFNDNFPEDGTSTGTVRIDAAIDIRPSRNSNIVNGDSATVIISDRVNGLSTGAIGGGTWASCYAYVGIYPQGKYSGSQIVDDPSRWPVVDSTTSPTGDMWYIVRLDTAFVPSGGAVLNGFCFDLNDNLFVAGDEIRYFIAAQNGIGVWSYFYDKEHATDLSAGFAPSVSNDIDVAYANYVEMTCLPSGNPAVDILYVDATDGRGVQPWFDTAFDQLGLVVDRFDVSQSGSSGLGQFGVRVQDVSAQLIPAYRTIIWNSGTLESYTVGDGTGATGSGAMKSDDWAVLYEFLDQHPDSAGVYLSGNGLAAEWFSQNGPLAVSTRSTYMNFNLVSDDHKSLPGMPASPLGIGQPGGIFDHILGPDTLVAFGGCPVLQRFGVLGATGASVVEMAYDNDPTRAVVLSQTTINQASSIARVVLSGFSLHLIRDDRPSGTLDRVEHLGDILAFLTGTSSTPTAVRASGWPNSLAQNYPNPFNPETTIEYTLRGRSHVTIRIYNVAGQLLRTLVNDARAAGPHQVLWDGRNNAGQRVSSGVYFYKLQANDFAQTKKMVLLK